VEIAKCERFDFCKRTTAYNRIFPLPTRDAMAQSREAILRTIPPNIPGTAVLNPKQTAALLDISLDTLDRLGIDGPPKVKLSPKRNGYQYAATLAWLAERSSK
jgi:hypothetical protein